MAFAPFDGAVPAQIDEQIVSFTPVDRVIPQARVRHVVAASSFDGVIAPFATNDVVAVRALEVIISRRPTEGTAGIAQRVEVRIVERAELSDHEHVETADELP